MRRCNYLTRIIALFGNDPFDFGGVNSIDTSSQNHAESVKFFCHSPSTPCHDVETVAKPETNEASL